MTVETDGEEKRIGEEKTHKYYQQGEVIPKHQTHGSSLCMCSHGVQKKSTTYLFETGRDLRSTGTLLTPTHYKSNLNLCYRRWRVY